MKSVVSEMHSPPPALLLVNTLSGVPHGGNLKVGEFAEMEKIPVEP